MYIETYIEMYIKMYIEIEVYIRMYIEMYIDLYIEMYIEINIEMYIKKLQLISHDMSAHNQRQPLAYDLSFSNAQMSYSVWPYSGRLKKSKNNKLLKTKTDPDLGAWCELSFNMRALSKYEFKSG